LLCRRDDYSSAGGGRQDACLAAGYGRAMTRHAMAVVPGFPPIAVRSRTAARTLRGLPLLLPVLDPENHVLWIILAGCFRVLPFGRFPAGVLPLPVLPRAAGVPGQPGNVARQSVG